MTEREEILEVIRQRESLAPEHIIELQLCILSTASSASIIETLRSCLSVLAARVCGEDALLVSDNRSSYDQWVSGMKEIAEAILAGVTDAAENPGSTRGYLQEEEL